MSFEVRRLTSDEWELFRLLRLRSLEDSPTAFGRTLEREQTLPDQEWQHRMLAPVFVAFGDEGPVGLVGCDLEEDTALVWGMWVVPERRGAGIGLALLDAAAEWAARTGARRVILGVTENNQPAARLYEGFGFRPTGESKPLGSNPSLRKIEMSLELGAPAS
jgi:GNAT superfamily N-acetyltransferase